MPNVEGSSRDFGPGLVVKAKLGSVNFHRSNARLRASTSSFWLRRRVVFVLERIFCYNAHMSSHVERAAAHLSNILATSLLHTPDHQALVIFDEEAPLTRILTDAYRQAIPTAEYLCFQEGMGDQILKKIDALKPKDLVILVQSSNFRLNDFRLRIELFKRQLKTIEHVHLNRMSEDQFGTYIEQLAYDPQYYRVVGPAIKQKLDAAKSIQVFSGGCTLTYDTQMEESRMNIGDYSGMENVGGTFPIGEVFTEAKDFSKVNGEAMIYGFGDLSHLMKMYKPFKIVIENSIVTRTEGAPPEFDQILSLIRQDEEVMVREFGVGLNPAVGKHALVNDITAFERQKGLHFSLGEKHSIYSKPGLRPKHTRYHVDIFVDLDRILVDGEELVF